MNLDTIKNLFIKYTEEKHFSGVGLIRQGNQDLFTYTHGYAHRGFRIPNTLATSFDTASITKLFTSVSIFQLIDKKLLSLSDKVLDLIDIGETSISKDITIYQLLTHTSGIGDDADEEAGESYEAIFKDKPNYSIRELRDFLPQFIHREANFAPGTSCRYNNCAFILLGLVIEQLSGMNYRDYIQQSIFDRLHMTGTGFYSMDGIHENVAEGYAAIYAKTVVEGETVSNDSAGACNSDDGGGNLDLDDCGDSGKNDEEEEVLIGYRKNIYAYPPVGGTDGGAFTTAPDLASFITGLKNGQLLSAESTAEIMKPQVQHVQRPTRSYYMGYGFEFIRRNSDGAIYCMKKDGCNVGVACEIRHYPEIDTTIVLLANTDACDIWELSYEISFELGIKTE